jgi:hypothetical protein
MPLSQGERLHALTWVSALDTIADARHISHIRTNRRSF